MTGDDVGADAPIAGTRRRRDLATELDGQADTPGSSTSEGSLVAIVEGTDAPPALRASKVVSHLIMVFRRDDLFRALPLVGRENRQREYYLNDVFPILLDKGERVSASGRHRRRVRRQLPRGARRGRARRPRPDQRGAHGEQRDDRRPERDVRRRRRADRPRHGNPSAHLPPGRHDHRLGGAIGPSTRIVDSRIEEGGEVPFSVVRAPIGGTSSARTPASAPGPSCPRISPGPARSSRSRASRIGGGSKVPHLSYVGDAEIGKDANVGAATVTVNYDGYGKHRTVIGDDARSARIRCWSRRSGSEGAVTGAGSVITKDVPPGALAVERSEQRTSRGTASVRTEARRAGEATKGEGERGGDRHEEEDDDVLRHHPPGPAPRSPTTGIPFRFRAPRFAFSGEIYFRSEESVRGADSS